MLEQMQTRLSLLVRLTKPGPCDEHAWREFVDHYAPLIYRWCRSHNLQDADAKDVTQQVLLKLATNLPAFTYDPSKSFRGWLHKLSYHAWVDFVSDRRQQGRGEAGVWSVLATVESREELLKQIDDEFDLELLEQAMEKVRARVEPATWTAFQLTAVEGLPGAEVAQRLGKQLTTVYAARCNVQKMLQEEITVLEAAHNGASDNGTTLDSI